MEVRAVKSAKGRIIRVMLWAVLFLLAAVMLFPVLYIVFGSFKKNAELLVGGSNIFPAQWIVDNYISA